MRGFLKGVVLLLNKGVFPKGTYLNRWLIVTVYGELVKGQALQQNLESHFITFSKRKVQVPLLSCFACRSEMIQHMICAQAIKLCGKHTKADAESNGSSRANEDASSPTVFSPGILL